MNDPVQSMPLLNSMIEQTYTVKQWANYYLNVWRRNLAARLIDVETDKALKAANAEQMVQSDDGRGMPVKERLEHRKILVQDAIDLIAGIEAIASMKEEEVANLYSKDALAVAEDMKPATPVAGDPCTVDGKAGTLQDNGKGELVCVVTPAPAEVPAEEKKDLPSDEAKV